MLKDGGKDTETSLSGEGVILALSRYVSNILPIMKKPIIQKKSTT
jgi:hypothetical protein